VSFTEATSAKKNKPQISHSYQYTNNMYSKYTNHTIFH